MPFNYNHKRENALKENSFYERYLFYKLTNINCLDTFGKTQMSFNIFVASISYTLNHHLNVVVGLDKLVYNSCSHTPMLPKGRARDDTAWHNYCHKTRMRLKTKDSNSWSALLMGLEYADYNSCRCEGH